ncbi:hypothetical protein, partial [Cronobacter dublinensis]|uniref:hypothetical protein n=1 Tax=Cronobacter dublinensis TaxID=413497 RepID=UPI0024AE3EF4
FLWAGAVTGFLPTGLSFGTTKICRDGEMANGTMSPPLHISFEADGENRAAGALRLPALRYSASRLM